MKLWILLLIPMVLMAQMDFKKEPQTIIDEYGKLKSSLIRQGPSSGLNADMLDNLDSLRFLRIRENGLVGLGTTIPDAMFHISSSAINLSRLFNISTGTVRLVEVMGSSVTFNIPVNFNSSIFGNGSALTGISAVSTSPWTRNSPYTILTNSGDNVGIGSASPVEKLEVVGAIKSRGNIASDSTDAIAMGTDGAGNSRILSWGSNGTTQGTFSFEGYANDGSPNQSYVNINASGNVGIGSASPAQKLDVNGNIAATNISASSGVYNNTLTAYAGMSGHVRNGFEINLSTRQLSTGVFNNVATATINNLGSRLLEGKITLHWAVGEVTSIRIMLTRGGTSIREWNQYNGGATKYTTHLSWVENPSTAGSQTYSIKIFYTATDAQVFQSDFSVIEY